MVGRNNIQAVRCGNTARARARRGFPLPPSDITTTGVWFVSLPVRRARPALWSPGPVYRHSRTLQTRAAFVHDLCRAEVVPSLLLS